MKRTYGIAAVALGAMLGASPALADDYDWTGPYGGVNIGAVVDGHTTWSDIMVPSDSGQDLPGSFVSGSLSSGVSGGGQLGYLYQSGVAVFGVEGRLGYADAKDKTECFGNYGDYSAMCRTRVKFNGQIVARAGFAVASRGLIYASGGYGFAKVRHHPTDEQGPYEATNGYEPSSKTRSGYVLGGGFEYALDDHIRLGVEYDYQDLGKYHVDFTGIAPVNEFNPDFNMRAKTHFSTLSARLNYRF